MGVDRELFTQLYEALYPRVLAYASRRVPLDTAYDVVDEAFLIAWRKREQLPRDGVLPWLLVTTRNIIANQRRRNNYQELANLELRHAVSNNLSTAPETDVIERFTVLTAFAELSQSDREALMLTVWDELTSRDAAKVAGCSTTAFTVRIFRARKRFSAALNRLDGQVLINDEVEVKTSNLERNLAQ